MALTPIPEVLDARNRVARSVTGLGDRVTVDVKDGHRWLLTSRDGGDFPPMGLTRRARAGG